MTNNDFTIDSVRSLVYLLCTGKVFNQIHDFENDEEIFADLPLIGFSTDISNDVKYDEEDCKYCIYLNTNGIYEVAKIAVRAFETYSLEKVFNEIKKHFIIHTSIYRSNKVTAFYRISMDKPLYIVMKGYYENHEQK